MVLVDIFCDEVRRANQNSVCAVGSTYGQTSKSKSYVLDQRLSPARQLPSDVGVLHARRRLEGLCFCNVERAFLLSIKQL
jgi:hypothetical protein